MPTHDQELVVSTTDNCRYCLMCRHVCPVGHVTSLETLTPHGWGLTIASQRRGLVTWNPETVNVIYACADCGACRSNCVTDQHLPEAIAAVRAEIVTGNLAPQSMLDLQQTFETFGNPYGKPVESPIQGAGDAALFVGDDAHYLRPDVLESAMTLLTDLGLNPTLIGVGRNSGYLASSLGFASLARQLAEANLKELQASGAKLLLVLSAGDYFTFGQLYHERLDISFPEGVDLFEVTAFFAQQLATGNLKLKKDAGDTPYAYVDPAHAVRVPGRHDAPRSLLAAVMSGLARELFWRRERTHPVGSTALQFTRPDIARKLTHARLQDARQSGARLLITEEAGTLHALTGAAAEYDLRVQGLYEILAAHLS